MLIDTHAHLDEIKDLEGALSRAREKGIQAVIGVGSGLASNEKTLELSERFPGFVFPALGLHPWQIEEEDLKANLYLMEKEIGRCVAFGEIGLDWAIASPRQKQEETLRSLLELAYQKGRPVLLHARRAWAEVLALLKTHKIEKAVFHWYSGPKDVLREALALGFFISATPAAAYSARHGSAIQRVSLNQLLVETDSPEAYQGIPSEPKELIATISAVSRLTGKGPEEVARQTGENAQKFFQINPS